jgi:hypothetical protein
MAADEHAQPAHPEPVRPDQDASFARWFEAHRGLILAVSLLSALLWTVLYLQYTVDDAYISFRYGKNLVAHHVWNWNPTGPHEEAYTSAVYTVLGVLPALVHLSPAFFFKLFGVACVGAMLLRLRALAVSRFAVLLGTLLIGVHPFVWIHAYAGLETPLYMLLLVELAICAWRAPYVSPGWVYALCLLLPLTRPEGIVFSAVGVALYWRGRGQAPKQHAWFGATVLAGIVYFLARWRYFHHLLPNPFYVKLFESSWSVLFRTLADNLLQADLYCFTLVLLFLLARERVTRVFALTSFLLMVLLFAPHAMPMNYADRFYFQLTLPVLLLFFIVEDAARNARILAIVSAVFLLALSPSGLIGGITYFPGLRRAQMDIGQRLATFSPDHVIFTGEAGVIPYYSGWVAYDFLGLGTYSFARDGITVEQLQRIHPDVILVFADAPGPESIRDSNHPGPMRSNTVVAQYLRQVDDYDYAGASRCDTFYLVSFVRRDTPQHDRIVATLQQNTETSATTHFSFRSLFLQEYVPWSQ